jgi:hypothetical protein
MWKLPCSMFFITTKATSVTALQQIFWRLNLRPRVCGRSLAGIVGSNPAEDTHVCLLCVLCVVRYRTLRRADHSSRGVLPSVMCLTECDHESSTMRRPWPSKSVAPWGGGGNLTPPRTFISSLQLYTHLTLGCVSCSSRGKVLIIILVQITFCSFAL